MNLHIERTLPTISFNLEDGEGRGEFISYVEPSAEYGGSFLLQGPRADPLILDEQGLHNLIEAATAALKELGAEVIA